MIHLFNKANFKMTKDEWLLLNKINIYILTICLWMDTYLLLILISYLELLKFHYLDQNY